MATEEELPEAAAPEAAGGGGGDDAEMRDAAAASGSDSDLLDSDSDSDDEGAAADDERRIQALEKTLQEQPLDYETHVQVSFAHLPPALSPSLSGCHGALGFRVGLITSVCWGIC